MSSAGSLPAVGLMIAPQSQARALWEYTWGQIAQMLGIRFVEAGSGEDPDVVIQYGETDWPGPQTRFIIRIPETVSDGRVQDASPNSMTRFESTREMKSVPLYCFSLFEKPMALQSRIWMKAGKDELIAVTANEHSIHCPIDIPATVLYFLSLGNESRTGQRDEHGRFRVAFNPIDHEAYQVAVVDRLIRLLKIMIEYAAGKPLPHRWPGQKVFALALSHDVDKFRNWTWTKVKRGLRNARFPGTYADMVRALIRPGNFSGNFKYIHESESRLGASSTFFFISKSRSSRDPAYRIQDPRIRKQIHLLKSIGLHGSYSGAMNAGFSVQEKLILEQTAGRNIPGIRSHYLRFDPARTLRYFSDAGFAYDSTLGFPEAAGWRCGTGFPFQPWQASRKSALPIYEMPLVMMDTSFFHYGDLSPETAWERMLPILDETEANGSCLVVNWHSNNVHPADPTGYTKLYWTLLEEAAARSGWVTDMDACLSWWKNRSWD